MIGRNEDGQLIAKDPDILDSSRIYHSHSEVYGAAMDAFLQQIQKIQLHEQRCRIAVNTCIREAG